MYIPEFVAGAAITILAELVLLIVAALVKSNKKK